MSFDQTFVSAFELCPIVAASRAAASFAAASLSSLFCFAMILNLSVISVNVKLSDLARAALTFIWPTRRKPPFARCSAPGVTAYVTSEDHRPSGIPNSRIQSGSRFSRGREEERLPPDLEDDFEDLRGKQPSNPFSDAALVGVVAVAVLVLEVVLDNDSSSVERPFKRGLRNLRVHLLVVDEPEVIDDALLWQGVGSSTEFTRTDSEGIVCHSPVPVRSGELRACTFCKGVDNADVDAFGEPLSNMEVSWTFGEDVYPVPPALELSRSNDCGGERRTNGTPKLRPSSEGLRSSSSPSLSASLESS